MHCPPARAIKHLIIAAVVLGRAAKHQMSSAVPAVVGTVGAGLCVCGGWMLLEQCTRLAGSFAAPPLKQSNAAQSLALPRPCPDRR